MKRRLLQQLKPTKYLCPFCGRWHDWMPVNKSDTIYLNFTSKWSFERWLEKRKDLGPLYMHSFRDCHSSQFYAYEDTLYCEFTHCFNYSSADLRSEIRIELINIDFENARIIFETKMPVRKQCQECVEFDECNIPKMNVVNDERLLYIPEVLKKHSESRYIIIPLAIQFEKNEFTKLVKST